MKNRAFALFFSYISCCLLCLPITSAHAQRLTKRKIEKVFKSLSIINEHYTGFILYDQQADKVVYESESHKPAVPASNTKLFTLYSALNMLGDSIPGIRYVIRGDSLIFWGTGDPSMLHPDLKSSKVYDFLKNSPFRLFYSASNYTPSSRSGSSSLQIELTPLPVGDNSGVVYAGTDGRLKITPSFLALKEDILIIPEHLLYARMDQGMDILIRLCPYQPASVELYRSAQLLTILLPYYKIR